MTTTLRSPQRLFTAAMWLVSLVFAGFLIGLGDKIIDDLRITQAAPIQENFADRAELAQARERIAAAQTAVRGLNNDSAAATAALSRARGAYESAKSSFDAWIATRKATGDPAKDPEVATRTDEVVQLRSEQERRQQALLEIQRRRDLQQQAITEGQRDVQRLIDDGAKAFQHAVRVNEPTVFAWRLAFTLPLLVVAGGFVARRQNSRYWPLMRGFVIAAGFAFFFELVPYLPSYGGHVRYVVGIVLTLIAGHYSIRWTQRYLLRRQQEELQSEADRRAHLNNEEALRKMKSDLCPGCERPIMTTGDVKPDFCCTAGSGCSTCAPAAACARTPISTTAWGVARRPHHRSPEVHAPAPRAPAGPWSNDIARRRLAH